MHWLLLWTFDHNRHEAWIFFLNGTNPYSIIIIKDFVKLKIRHTPTVGSLSATVEPIGQFLMGCVGSERHV